MSLENEGCSSALEAADSVIQSEKKPRILYTGDFLLSLSELEICKSLPSGFDQSILREFEENSILLERARTHGTLPLHGFHRNNYSSSPPTRGDSSNFEAGDSVIQSEKKPRILYTRDFLLSLSELEICKSLPSGFDQSILRDFEENIILEWARTHGTLPLHGFHRNNYSSSPPTRGDSSNFEAADSVIQSEKKPRILYTRDFLLSLIELEICKSLPSGFDQSILREFEENIILERARTHGTLPLHGFHRNNYSSSPPTRGDSSNFEAADSVIQSEKKPRILYTRDFLLSLSELEICKSLPSGFDQSILREFEENIILERARTHGTLPLHGFHRNNYSSSPPTRGDSTFKEFEENSILELARKHGTLPLHGFHCNNYSSSPPTRGDSNNFSRYGRWDSRSSGWSYKDGDAQSDLDSDSGKRNYGNQSRRPLQNSEHDGLLGSGSFPRPSGIAGGTSASKGPTATNEHYHLNKSTGAYKPPRPFKAVSHSGPNTHDSFNDETFGSIESTSQDRSEEERKRRASFELMRKEQRKVLQEKQKINAKDKSDDFSDLIFEEAKEEGVPKDDSGKSNTLLQSSKPRPLVPPGFKSTVLEKSSCTKPISSTEKEILKPGIEEILLLAKGNHTQNETLDNKGSIQSGDHLNRISGFPELHEAVDGEVFELATNKISNSSLENTTSILGRLFGSGPTIKDCGPIGFPENIKPDDSPSPRHVKSSRFAQWFNEDKKKHGDDVSSSRPNDLLSLIGGSEKADTITPEISYKGFEITKTPSDPKHLFNNFSHESASPPVAAVLTCEDLEQTIMSENSEKSSNILPPIPDWTYLGQENMDARPVDSQVTQHLLSLLQKGSTINDGPNTNVGPVRPIEAHPANSKEVSNSGQNLSLEALFGTAFMKELQSAQAPVSVPRAPPGSARMDYFKPHDLSVSNVDGMGPIMKQPVKSDDPENWLRFNGQQVKVDPSEIHMPKEESLIIGGDATNTHNSNMAFDVSEKLEALNSEFRGRGPYDMSEPERQFNNNQNQKLMFHPLDTNPQHMNSQMSFLDQIMQLDNTNINKIMPRNMHAPGFHHPDAKVAGLNVPVNPDIHHQVLPQMRMQGTFPPPQLQASNFMPGHGFNIGGPGLPFSVPVADGTNHPEAFQRMEMEMWAQSKQVRPVNAGHVQGIYGHVPELDMSFRYR